MRLFICLLFAAALTVSATCVQAGDVFDTKAAQPFIKKGRALMAKKQYDKAIAEFEEALKINPDSSEAQYLIGYSRYQQRKMPSAYDAFSETYEVNWKYEPGKRVK